MDTKQIEERRNSIARQIEERREKEFDWEKSVQSSELAITQETEKAIKVTQCGADMRIRSVWLPKSMLDKYWFVNKKFDEANMLLRV